MKTSWIKQITEDKLELSALLFEPEKKSETIVIYLHGKEGNFIMNRFLFTMKEAFPDKGIAFMTVNQRGHDYLADSLIETATGFEYKKIGFAYEIFEDCLKDIKPFVDKAEELGYKRIFYKAILCPINQFIIILKPETSG